MTPSLPPDCAARFRVERLLGQGGFGAVYLARQLTLDRVAAVKVLHVAQAGSDQVGRFRAEARLTAALAHPNIVKVLDYGWESGAPWIAYEYVAGSSLRARLQAGPLPPDAAIDAAIQVLDALEAAHAAGALHRDVKPDNVLEDDGRWLLADFGIAKWTCASEVRTATGVILGSPVYLSPEQIQGQPASPASDVYSVGIMLHELIQGAPPFEAENLFVVLEMHLRKEIPPLDAARVPGLEAVVARALAKDPLQRFRSAAEMAAALRALVPVDAPAEAPRETGGARRITANARAITARVTRSKQAVPAAAGVGTARRWLGAAAAIFAIGIGAFAARRPVPDPEPPPSPSASPAASAAAVVPIAAWPARVVPLGDRIWLSFARPLERDVQVRIAARVTRIPAGATAAYVERLRPGSVVRLSLAADDRPVAPAQIQCETGKVRAQKNEEEILLEAWVVSMIADVEAARDPRAADLVAARLLRPKEKLPQDHARHVWRAAELLHHADLLTALAGVQVSGDTSHEHIALAYRFVEAGFADAARSQLALVDPTSADFETGRWAFVRARTGERDAEKLAADLEKRPPLAVDCAARALVTAGIPAAGPALAARLTRWRTAGASLRRTALLARVYGAADRVTACRRELADPASAPDGDLLVRELVAQGTPEARAAVVAAVPGVLTSPDAIWEVARATATGEPAPEVEAALVRLASGSAATPLRSAAAAALGLGRTPASAAELARLLDGPGLEPSVVESIAWTLVRRREHRADAAIVKHLAQQDTHGVLAWAVGMHRIGGAGVALTAALKESVADPAGDPVKRQPGRWGFSAWALARLGDPAGRALLDRPPRDHDWAQFLREQLDEDAREDARQAHWLFPFVGYDLLAEAGAGELVSLAAPGLWIARSTDRVKLWDFADASNGLPVSGRSDSLSVILCRGGTRERLHRLPMGFAAARPEALFVSTADSGHHVSVPSAGSENCAGAAVVRVRTFAPPR